MANGKSSAAYFKSVSLLIWITSISLFSLLHFASYNQKAMPDQYMGPVGTFYRWLAYEHPWGTRVGYHVLMVTHVLEGFYTLHLTNRYGITDTVAKIKWFLQTLVCGFSSWMLLKKKFKKRAE
uniref:Transmembrane protein 254 n=1 Tax=Phallusia mammillata TaxID=59560 RepID=A0A6F9DVT4_9ASCI|nr:transmembrane protein 254-like [Phallusia mammillata]